MVLKAPSILKLFENAKMIAVSAITFKITCGGEIFLFWKALNKFDKHGKIFTCRVVVEFVVIVRLRNIVSS